jgi:hypothetical protein
MPRLTVAGNATLRRMRLPDKFSWMHALIARVTLSVRTHDPAEHLG